MATESATFTALPNGLHESGDFYRVTIFVTPRLLTDGAGVLGMSNVDYPAFFDWPATLAGTVFGLELDNIGSVETVPDPDMPPPDSATWHALFDKTSVRDGEVRDFANTRFTSFPVADATKYMLDLYREVAEGYPSAFPPITVGPLAGLVADIGNLSQFGRARYYPILEGEFTEVHHSQGEGVKDRVWRYVDRSRFPVDAQGNKDPLLVFAEAYRFHDRPGARELAALDPVYPEPKPPDIDFHGFVSFCGDYPKLMRRLGLAVDVLMKRPPNIKVEDKVRVEVRDAPPAALPWMQTEAARPWTNYETKGRLFLARPKDREGDLVDGMLRLEWAWRFPVNQIDVDGGALKTVDFAGNLQRLYEHLQGRNGVSMTDDAASLPALRSSGFMVSRDARTAKIVAHLDNVAQNTDHHAQDQAIELFAEDVNRGHRLDIEDQTKPGRWRSLHQRIGDYQLQQADNSKVPLPVEISPDEGYVKGASMSAVPEKEDDQYLHEAMFGWEGWSLAAKRPGQAIRNMDVAEPVKDDANENPYPMPLVTHFEPVPGSLPRLRIGSRYRFHARAVDLAGNSVRDEDIDPNHVTTAHTWQRWDPVPSPAVVPRRQFTEGESLMRMVIRSTLDLLPPAYVAQSRIVDLPGHETEALRYLDVNDRHIAPPIGSQQLAEWHAKFDAAVGESAADPTLDAQFAIAARESGSFLHAGPNVFTVNPSHPDQLTPLPIGDEKGAHLNPGEYVCHDVDELDLPYLPDPLSIGGVVHVAPRPARDAVAAVGADYGGRAVVRPSAAPCAHPGRIRPTGVRHVDATPDGSAAAGRVGHRQPRVVSGRRSAGAVRPVDAAAARLPQPVESPDGRTRRTQLAVDTLERADVGAHGREAPHRAGDPRARVGPAEHRRPSFRRRDVRGAVGRGAEPHEEHRPSRCRGRMGRAHRRRPETGAGDDDRNRARR